MLDQQPTAFFSAVFMTRFCVGVTNDIANICRSYTGSIRGSDRSFCRVWCGRGTG